MAKQTENNVGIYLRLSQEDMREGDSLSIDNQKLILTKFVTEKAGISFQSILMTAIQEQILKDRAYRNFLLMHNREKSTQSLLRI